MSIALRGLTALIEPQRGTDCWEVWLYHVADTDRAPIRARRLCVCDNDTDAINIADAWNRPRWQR